MNANNMKQGSAIETLSRVTSTPKSSIIKTNHEVQITTNTLSIQMLIAMRTWYTHITQSMTNEKLLGSIYSIYGTLGTAWKDQSTTYLGEQRSACIVMVICLSAIQSFNDAVFIM